MKPVFHQAIVEMFGKRKRCQVSAYGTPQDEYLKGQMVWVERGEDEYAVLAMKPPFCLLQRRDWLEGVEV